MFSIFYLGSSRSEVPIPNLPYPRRQRADMQKVLLIFGTFTLTLSDIYPRLNNKTHRYNIYVMSIYSVLFLKHFWWTAYRGLHIEGWVYQCKIKLIFHLSHGTQMLSNTGQWLLISDLEINVNQFVRKCGKLKKKKNTWLTHS